MNWQTGLSNINMMFPPEGKLFHCVIGNESCDLDSFVSSLVLAITENKVHLINLKYELFVLKPEILKVCEVFDIPIRKLLFYNKDTKKIENSKNETFDLSDWEINATLTDHNESVIETMKVKEVYDHHIILNGTDLSSCRKVHIDLTLYSCCSIIFKLDKHFYLKGLTNLTKKATQKHKDVLLRKSNIDPETPFNHGLLLLLFITMSVDSYNIILYTRDNHLCPNYLLLVEISKKLRLKGECIEIIFNNFQPKAPDHFNIQNLLTDYKSFVIKGESIESSSIYLNKLPEEADLQQIREFFSEKGIEKYFVMFLIKKRRYLLITNLEVPENEVKKIYGELKEVNMLFSRKRYIEFLSLP